MKFEIDPKYLTSITVRYKHSRLKDPQNPTPEDLIKIIKGEDHWVSTGTQDHPEFTKLRDQLEQLGYIRTQRTYWNGDVVLKPFYLNGTRFKKNSQFCCAAAIKHDIKVKNYKV